MNGHSAWHGHTRNEPVTGSKRQQYQRKKCHFLLSKKTTIKPLLCQQGALCDVLSHEGVRFCECDPGYRSTARARNAVDGSHLYLYCDAPPAGSFNLDSCST
jgi:hypothetical protein